MRDLAVFAAVFGLLPFCVARPWIGVLVYAWVGYMNPHRLTWGLAWDFPFAQVVALATLVGFVLYVIREGFPRIPWERETILLVLLWVMFTFTSYTALRPDLAWPEWNKISKILLMTFLTIALIDTEKKLRYLALTIALSLGFYGFKGGLFALATAGAHRVFGPEGSFIEDNNALGLALNMTLPFLFFLARSEEKIWLKRGLYATFGLTIFAVQFTYSRGAFLGLVVVLGMIYLRLGWRVKTAIALVLILALPVAIGLFPGAWVERIQSIRTFGEDDSAMGRIQAWTTAWRVAVDRPLVGGGFQIIDDSRTYALYNPGLEKHRGVHSVFFEILGENGFITFGIFVAMLGLAILSMRWIRRRTVAEGPLNLYCYACMFEISLVAYAVTGTFLELASYDLFYQILAMSIVLKALMRVELSHARERQSLPGPRELRPAVAHPAWAHARRAPIEGVPPR